MDTIMNQFIAILESLAKMEKPIDVSNKKKLWESMSNKAKEGILCILFLKHKETYNGIRKGFIEIEDYIQKKTKILSPSVSEAFDLIDIMIENFKNDLKEKE